MSFLLFLGVVLSTMCTVSGAFDPQCDESCNCCKDGLCHVSNYFPNHCSKGCIDGHRSGRCYELCQYTNCRVCGDTSASRVCEKCYDGYYLGSNKDCASPCPSNCKTCTSRTKCTECKEGYYDKGDSTTCPYVHCPANCVCNDQGECVSCKNGYYDTSTSCIKQCPVNCLTCVSEESCNKCKNRYYNGYEYDIKTNVQLHNCTYVCKEACTQCVSYNTCLQCVNGKYGSTCQTDCSVGCKYKTCSFDLGQCECTNNFTGDKCMECVNGNFGLFCNQTCSKDCKGHTCNRKSGDCSDGCINANITENRCNMCKEGMYGELCNMTCPNNCKSSKCKRDSGVCSDGCIGNFNGTMCDVCKHGKYGENCDRDCPVQCAAQQKKDAPKSGVVATAAVLGSMFTLLFAVNIVLLALFLLKKVKISWRKHSKTETEPTYENQLQSVGEQFPRTTPDAADTLHPEAIERNIYEGISCVDEKEHEYQHMSYEHGNRV